MAESLHNAPIVIDNGSGTIRAGFAGDDLPKCYFPSFVGRPKHLRVLAGALEGDVFIGEKAAKDFRGLLKIRYPLEHGIVTDWDDMERIWSYVYEQGLKTLSEEASREDVIPLGTGSLLTGFFVASRPPDRATAEPAKQPRHSGADSLRNVQRAGTIHVNSSGALTICEWTNDWRGPGRW